ncbi:unnamed protein product [Closterium sp. NIES-64]|nr:unnamed protein product [Closterium sp. NIES-64]CAI6012540.1 unnamed protein product [Closterium sp. NIES-65]
MAPSAQLSGGGDPKTKVEITDLWVKNSSKLTATKSDRGLYPTTGESDGKEAEPLLPDKVEKSVEEVKQLVRSRSAKQFTWVLLLKAHKAAGCVAWLGYAIASLFRNLGTRLSEDDQEDDEEEEEDDYEGLNARPSQRLLWTLRVLSVLSLALLAFEVLSHSSELEWEFQLHNPTKHVMPLIASITARFHAITQDWVIIRTHYIAPPLQWFANACIYLFLVQTVDRLVLCLGCIWINVMGIKPRCQPLAPYDPEEAGQSYPMVLVQIPMCNEREVYDQSIGAACKLEWPRERMLIQVLDDSSDDEIQKLIEAECLMWQQRGYPIIYRHRVIRTGYKAGNLQSGMNCEYVKKYEFVAIFDADFQPKPDFLKLTVPHFKNNPDVALVQARWNFVNKDENLLTKLQTINLRFHFEVEQQVNGAFINFFGFNGTAGVWRITALEESGGWMDRTTVEDMDIAVRAHLKGWRFLFLNDVEAMCELPESYEAFRKQQHRWHSGPMQLFRLCLPDIITAKIALWKKLNMIFLFFLLRKMILPFYSFMLFCIILPLTMFVPEAQLPLWVVCYIPGIMSLLNVLPSPKYFPFMIPYLLFENTMSVTKFQAMIAGLFQLKSAHEWVVTKKSGRSTDADQPLATTASEPLGTMKPSKSVANISRPSTPPAAFTRTASEGMLNVRIEDQLKVKIDQPLLTTPPKSTEAITLSKPTGRKLYKNELALALLLLVAAARSLLTVAGMHFYFLLFQGFTFLIVALDLISDRQ